MSNHKLPPLPFTPLSMLGVGKVYMADTVKEYALQAIQESASQPVEIPRSVISVFSDGIRDLIMNDPSVRMLYEVAKRSGASREAMFESMVLQLAKERKHLADKLTNAVRNDPTQIYFDAVRRSRINQ